jgi:hypothetical protein
MCVISQSFPKQHRKQLLKRLDAVAWKGCLGSFRRKFTRRGLDESRLASAIDSRGYKRHDEAKNASCSRGNRGSERLHPGSKIYKAPRNDVCRFSVPRYPTSRKCRTVEMPRCRRNRFLLFLGVTGALAYRSRD